MFSRPELGIHMTNVLLRQTGFQKEIRTPSRFLNELPEGGVNLTSIAQVVRDQADEELNRKTKTLSKLSAIKESLQKGII